jgi:hypothetical protein
VTPRSTAPFTTRIVVRRPADPSAFNGTVVVEWHNVSSGHDAAPDWTYMADEVVRRGYAWVGVSAQAVGAVGGTSLVGMGDSVGLLGSDPDRYGSLDHPGDAHSYDLFTQVGEVLRDPGAVDPLGGLRPERLLAVGESQSAFRLTGYLNAVQELDNTYDGVLVHSRGATASGVDDATTRPLDGPVYRIRDDLSIPVIVLEMETDVGRVLNYHAARQPDTDRLRVWEVAGTAHADLYQVGGFGDLFGCAHLLNDGPQHLLVKSALRHLDGWVRGDSEPPTAPRLTAVDGPRIVRDGFGNALGGIRTPLVDVPSAVLTGEPPRCDNLLCFLFGSTVPFDAARMHDLYGSPEAYLDAYTRSADDSIASGFVLEDDRDALLAMSHEERFDR